MVYSAGIVRTPTFLNIYGNALKFIIKFSIECYLSDSIRYIEYVYVKQVCLYYIWSGI